MMHIHTSNEGKYSYIFFRINKYLSIKVVLISFIFILVFNIIYSYKLEDFIALLRLPVSKIIAFFSPEKKFELYIANRKYLMCYSQYSKYFNESLFDYYDYTLKAKSILFWLPYQLFLLLLSIFAFFRLFSYWPSTEHLEGKMIVSEKKLKKQLKNYNGDIPVGPFSIPFFHETKHVFFSGNPVYGKNIFLNDVIDKIIKRKDKAIIYDSDGKYISRFYRPELDYIFNPFDARCVKWNIFNDIFLDQDANFIAASIVPKGVEYSNEAILIIAAILRHLVKHNKKNNEDLLKLASLRIAAISDIIRDQVVFEISKKYQPDKIDQIQKLIIKSLSILKSFKQNEGDFSFTEWVENKNGNIYISDVNSNAHISSFFINPLVYFIYKKLQEDINKRVFLIFDNFENLPKQSWIETVLYNGNEKGLSLWIGITKNHSIKRNYGDEAIKNIIGYCGCKVFFRPHDSEMSKLISESAGKKTFRLMTGQLKSDPDYIQEHNKKITEYVISSDSLMHLQEFMAYITFSGTHFAKVCFENRVYPSINKNFIYDAKTRLTTNPKIESVAKNAFISDSINVSKDSVETVSDAHKYMPENEDIRIEIDKKLDNQIVKLE